MVRRMAAVVIYSPLFYAPLLCCGAICSAWLACSAVFFLEAENYLGSQRCTFALDGHTMWTPSDWTRVTVPSDPAPYRHQCACVQYGYFDAVDRCFGQVPSNFSLTLYPDVHDCCFSLGVAASPNDYPIWGPNGTSLALGGACGTLTAAVVTEGLLLPEWLVITATVVSCVPVAVVALAVLGVLACIFCGSGDGGGGGGFSARRAIVIFLD